MTNQSPFVGGIQSGKRHECIHHIQFVTAALPYVTAAFITHHRLNLLVKLVIIIFARGLQLKTAEFIIHLRSSWDTFQEKIPSAISGSLPCASTSSSSSTSLWHPQQ